MPGSAWCAIRRSPLMCDTPFILRELNVVEQRYRAVLEVLSGSGIAGAGSRGAGRRPGTGTGRATRS